MLPIPMTRGGPGLQDLGYQFPPPCYDPTPPRVLGQVHIRIPAVDSLSNPCCSRLLGQGICSGEWMNNITMYDYLRVPKVPAGEYVLGFRWDCESSAQVWQQCSDITVTA